MESRSAVDQLRQALGAPSARPLAPVGLFIMGVLVMLYVARVVFIPLTLALMLSFLFRPLVRGLERIYVPSAIAGALIVGGLVGGAGYGAVRLAEPVVEWAEKLPGALRIAEQKIRPLKRPVGQVTDLAERVERFTEVEDKKKKSMEVTVEEPSLLDAAVTSAGNAIAGAIVTILTLYFLLISGDRLLERLIAFLPNLTVGKQSAGQVIRIIEGRMSAYLGAVTVINVALGTAVWITMDVLQMPNPVLWGVLAAALTYIPYLGHLVGVLVVGLVALVTFNDATSIIAPPAAYFALAALEGQIVTPLVLGHAFRISPLIIFVWLVFWGWLWGVAGALIAVPLLMLIKITCEQSAELAPIADFMQR